MRILVYFTLFYSFSTYSCVDLSGLYEVDSQKDIKLTFTQNNCDSVKISSSKGFELSMLTNGLENLVSSGENYTKKQKCVFTGNTLKCTNIHNLNGKKDSSSASYSLTDDGNILFNAKTNGVTSSPGVLYKKIVGEENVIVNGKDRNISGKEDNSLSSKQIPETKNGVKN